MIKGEVIGASPGDFLRVSSKIVIEAKKVLRTEAALLAGHTRSAWMSGPRPVRLGVASGDLRASTKPLPVTERAGSIDSGVSFGTQYARTHIGPRGKVTTVKPVNRQWLAIPLDAAKTRAGVARGGPRSGVWGKTFVAKSKRGNLIIFGRKTVQKGASAGATRGSAVPLFVLKKEVKIKTRVHPEDMMAWVRPRITQEFRLIGLRLGVGGGT